MQKLSFHQDVLILLACLTKQTVATVIYLALSTDFSFEASREAHFSH